MDVKCLVSVNLDHVVVGKRKVEVPNEVYHTLLPNVNYGYGLRDDEPTRVEEAFLIIRSRRGRAVSKPAGFFFFFFSLS